MGDDATTGMAAHAAEASQPEDPRADGSPDATPPPSSDAAPDASPHAPADRAAEPDAGPASSDLELSAASPATEAYFRRLDEATEAAYAVARRARERGLDPETHPEVPPAKDLAERVENLVGPPGVADRIRELSREMDREAVSLQVAREVAQGRFGRAFEGPDAAEAALDAAVRTGLAILTEGVLVAPLEGIAKVRVLSNDDGSTCAALVFAGPIRSAGGTGEALSVLIADVVRRELGLSRYRATRAEVERLKEEIPAYKRAVNLQYTPDAQAIERIAEGCPVMIDGEGTEDQEVSGYRDLPRLETNRLRGGACLVIAEGVAQKAAKLNKHVERLGIDGWEFLDAVRGKDDGNGGDRDGGDGGDGGDGNGGDDDGEGPGEAEPPDTDGTAAADGTAGADGASESDPVARARSVALGDTYLQDLVAGRPVLAHPSRPGGFRLRYGRSRTGGLASTAIHPAVMVLVDDFLAVGTQMKLEGPGKATVATPCDALVGPTVLLDGGDVVRVGTTQQAHALKDRVERILDLGELLVPFGEFLENNKPLLPGTWTEAWWRAEVEAAGQEPKALPTAADAFAFAEATGTPLHPAHTLLWHDLGWEGFSALRGAVLGPDPSVELDAGSDADASGPSPAPSPVLTLPADDAVADALIALNCPHRRRDGRLLVEDPEALLRPLGLRLTGAGGADEGNEGSTVVEARDPPAGAGGADGPTVMEAAADLAGVALRPAAPTRLGARVGRPEKAAPRKMKPPIHVLFPLGQAGGMQRLVKQAAAQDGGTVSVEVGQRRCADCGERTPLVTCPDCDGHTEPVAWCPGCGTTRVGDPCPQCGAPTEGRTSTEPVPLADMLQRARDRLGEGSVPDVKGVIGTISAKKTPEPLEKGILRAKHDVWVFKDGTLRYDMTDVPLTHFRPREIGLTVERARELGYAEDVEGEPLESPDQLVELNVQDLVVARDCGEYLLRCAAFVDDLLVRYYHLDRFYEAERPEDLVGHLVVGLAPHTSGGVLGRLIGFVDAQVGFAHPYFHAAKRRNCDGDEDCVLLLLDGLLNFSQTYLPSSRGGLMDAPLVLTTRIDPNEIDKEAHNLDVGGGYPLALYRAAARGAHPKEVADAEGMDLASHRLGTPRQYEGFAFTDDTADVCEAPAKSAYKTLGSMIEKMEAQLAVGARIRAVDVADVAGKVITTHFLPDLVGNLKAFSRQKVRCAKCNAKYRRVPLTGRCRRCDNHLTLTVHEASVTKYLDVARDVAHRYDVGDYTLQRIDLVDHAIRSLFTNDKVTKAKLEDFF